MQHHQRGHRHGQRGRSIFEGSVLEHCGKIWRQRAEPRPRPARGRAFEGTELAFSWAVHLLFDHGAILLRDPPEDLRTDELPGVFWDPRRGRGCAAGAVRPYALFRRTLLYGRALSQLVPLLPWCQRSQLSADCVLRGRLLRFELGPGEPIFPSSAPREYDSLLEERLAREFRRTCPRWELVREPEPIDAGGSLVFPDFALFHSETSMYEPPPRLAAYLIGLELIEFLGHIHGYQVPEWSEAERIIDDVGEMIEVLERLQRSRSARRLPAARARVAGARQRFLDTEVPERHQSFALGKLDLILHELRSSAMAAA